ncbi:MAG: hypothetical protein EU541_01425 [Promethearchaeota archaeon]|nr:MAG: hypothetical protein EU541_01425 [Candidatus Lokiarchaeota archaeon]
MPTRIERTDDINTILNIKLKEGYEMKKRKVLKDFWGNYSLKATLTSKKGTIRLLGIHNSECKDTVILRSKNESLFDKLPIA